MAASKVLHHKQEVSQMIYNSTTRQFYRNILGSLLCLAFILLIGGCGDSSDKGPAEQAGEKIDKAIKEGTASMKDAMDKTGSAVNDAAENAGQMTKEAMEGAEKKMGEMSEAVKETTEEAVKSAEKMVDESTK
ncbi:MAG: hypothetical protein AB7P17_06105 [Nitrospirales bacterium]